MNAILDAPSAGDPSLGVDLRRRERGEELERVGSVECVSGGALKSLQDKVLIEILWPVV